MIEMTPLPTKETYLDMLLLYHEEEVMGEAYFNALADHFDDPDHKSKLRLLAKVERRAAESVRPLLVKYSLKPRPDSTLAQLGSQDAEKEGKLSWDAFVNHMARDYKGYMPYFLALEAVAPRDDLPTLKVLTEHETISIKFAEYESLGASNATTVLERYIGGA